MKEREIQLIHFNKKEGNPRAIQRFRMENVQKAVAFHKSFPEYSMTPLVQLDALAEAIGVSKVFVKDESYRFGLNAFKVLGGSYAIGNYIARRLQKDISELPSPVMASAEVKEALGPLTFITATDGNHGRGIAWTANRLGQRSVVYMPKGSSLERLHNIQALGAEASVTDVNYDDAVRLANAAAEKNGWIMVQDTAWEGYEEIPGWIMEGYTTMAYEAIEQLCGEKPTHIFLQAGVGAMAGAVAGFFANLYPGDEKPIITIVEPHRANCLFRTAQADDGHIHSVEGDLNTIMAGLACGEPCTIAWEVFRSYADNFVSIPEHIAAKGMRILGNPAGGDRKIISGESGAAALGFVAEVMENHALAGLREQLGLCADSKVLCFSTEGATDRTAYREIVWDGRYPSC